MAQRRMFNKSVTNNDSFLEMPDSSQNLYFHLSMNADDDGFVDNWKSIMRMTGHKEDDLKVLIAKQYVIPFESGVIVIKHWRLNNYLRNDRFTQTQYKNELEKLTIDDNNVYQMETIGIPNGNPDKIRLDKISIDNNIICQNETKNNSIIYEEFKENYNTICTNLPKVLKITDKRKKAIKNFLKDFTIDDFKTICKNINSDKWCTGNNDRHWKADFDYLMRTDKAIRFLETQNNSNKKQIIEDDLIKDLKFPICNDGDKILITQIIKEQMIFNGDKPLDYRHRQDIVNNYFGTDY